MGKRCVVGGCSNTHQQNVSLHKFPKDSKYHRLWVAAVKRTRKDWLGPSSQSYVCGAHFTSESFVSSYRLSAQLGIGAPTTRRLQDNAVPSIFGESISKSRDEIGTSRPVVAKLDRKRLMAGPTETGTPSKQPGPSHSGDDGPSAAVASSSGQTEKPPGSPDYTPSVYSSDESEHDNDGASRDQVKEPQDRLFLVQESCLLSLFKICHQCGGQIDADISRIQGSLIRISQVCRDCSRHSTWTSQTFVSGIPLGNLILSASILFTGARPHQALKIFNNMKCPVHNVRTYMRHQRQWLQPVIQHVWLKKQAEIFSGLKEIAYH
ncbi:hypothetical protein BSL78_27577 [Apostichopus japonicus]|uniref:THAP-type domain-containing protein n=1 Tax=Stichopus japonicus TaxID=307972 RepID=A0A2G8JIN3_STIJA|nr:hypothetical protein BSL78_27577 [Apostichopus japonicus]